MVNTSRFPPEVGRFDLTHETRVAKNKDLLQTDFSLTCDFFIFYFLVLIVGSTFQKFPWQRKVMHVATGWTVIPVDTMNLHWQKDNSNDIHLISLDRFRTCFSLRQKWIREQ